MQALMVHPPLLQGGDQKTSEGQEEGLEVGLRLLEIFGCLKDGFSCGQGQAGLFDSFDVGSFGFDGIFYGLEIQGDLKAR